LLLSLIAAANSADSLDVSEGEFIFCMDERQNKYFSDVAAYTIGADQRLPRGLALTSLYYGPLHICKFDTI
jgi:hypothetical protein